jgi:ABC-type transporter Mla subunit MlaD
MSPSGPTRRSQSSIVASPVLVGAVTVLVVLVAVFLSYNANNGLPFVPTRELKVNLPNGNELVKGNEVREGGFRIGVVSAMKPVRLANGTVVAQATLKLDKKAGAFPIDSTATIRPRSALGLENVNLTKGTSSKTISDGGTLPVSQTNQEVELDQVFSMFDQPTRDASRTDLIEFGNAFAGRGADLNATIQRLPDTFKYLTPVATNLSSQQTDLQNFFKQLDITAATIAPVSKTFAHLFTTMANTFAAIDRDPNALQQTIVKNPGTEDVGTASFKAQIPFLLDSAKLGRALTPATVALRGALPVLNQALEVGTRVTARTPVLYSNLQLAMEALKNLATAPTTNAALRGLTATVGTLQPQLRYLGPYITVCNDWTSFWTWAAESQTGAGVNGTVLRSELNSTNNQNNSLSHQESATPANGDSGGQPGQPLEYLHAQPYGAAVTNSGAADCEFGQRGYINRSPNAPPGYNVANDPHNEVGYPAGPTYAFYDKVKGGQGLGPTHVPAGETFTREPGGLGALVDPNLRSSP